MRRRQEALVIILFGVAFGLIPVFLSQLSFVSYVLFALSVFLIVYGAYLYANESRLDSNWENSPTL